MSQEPFEHDGEVVLEPQRPGPVVVRGASRVRDRSGREHPVARRVVALCTCAKSALAPWCDGTHKVLPHQD